MSFFKEKKIEFKHWFDLKTGRGERLDGGGHVMLECIDPNDPEKRVQPNVDLAQDFILNVVAVNPVEAINTDKDYLEHLNPSTGKVVFVTNVLCCVCFILIALCVASAFLEFLPEPMFWVPYMGGGLLPIVFILSYCSSIFYNADMLLWGVRNTMTLNELHRYLEIIDKLVVRIEFKSSLRVPTLAAAGSTQPVKNERVTKGVMNEKYYLPYSWTRSEDISWETLGIDTEEKKKIVYKEGALCMLRFQLDAHPGNEETKDRFLKTRNHFFSETVMKNPLYKRRRSSDVPVHFQTCYLMEHEWAKKIYALKPNALIWLPPGTKNLGHGSHSSKKNKNNKLPYYVTKCWIILSVFIGCGYLQHLFLSTQYFVGKKYYIRKVWAHDDIMERNPAIRNHHHDEGSSSISQSDTDEEEIDSDLEEEMGLDFRYEDNDLRKSEFVMSTNRSVIFQQPMQYDDEIRLSLFDNNCSMHIPKREIIKELIFHDKDIVRPQLIPPPIFARKNDNSDDNDSNDEKLYLPEQSNCEMEQYTKVKKHKRLSLVRNKNNRGEVHLMVE